MTDLNRKYGERRRKIYGETTFNSKNIKILIYDTQKEKHQVKAFLLFRLILIYLALLRLYTLIHIFVSFFKVSSKRPYFSSSNTTCYHSAINIEATEDLKVKTSAQGTVQSREKPYWQHITFSVLFPQAFPTKVLKTAVLSSLRENKQFETGVLR